MNEFEQKINLALGGLSLEFFEEEEHPRGRGGKFASKGSGGGSSDEEKPSYNREEIRSKIKAEDRAKNWQHAKNGLLALGVGALVVSGHPFVGAALAGGIAAHKIHTVIKQNALRVTAKYGTKAIMLPGKAITRGGRELYHAGSEVVKGVGEAVGFSHTENILASKSTIKTQQKLQRIKNAVDLATQKYS